MTPTDTLPRTLATAGGRPRSHTRLVLLLVFGTVSGALMGKGFAASFADVELAPADDGGIAMLRKAATAAHSLDYQGTQLVVSWTDAGSSSALVEVSHAVGQGTTLRVAATPDSPGGRLYRDDAALGAGTTVDPRSLALLEANYVADLAGTEDVAGRPTDVVVVRRPGQSPAARFWIDRDSRLILRREVLDGEGRVLRESAFLSIAMQRPTNMEVSPAAPPPTGDSLEPAGADSLIRDGWRLPSSLPQGMALFDVRVAGESDARVVHLSYSDGVSTVSVFEQRGRLDASKFAGWTKSRLDGHRVWVAPGYPRRVVWAGAGLVYTVVAECQRAELNGLVDSLPHEKRHLGFWQRLWRGLCRVGSWINPFD